MATPAFITMEHWKPRPSATTCYGCRYLAGVGPFVSQTCPRPPLHPHCNCRVRVIPTGGLSSAARRGRGPSWRGRYDCATVADEGDGVVTRSAHGDRVIGRRSPDHPIAL